MFNSIVSSETKKNNNKQKSNKQYYNKIQAMNKTQKTKKTRNTILKYLQTHHSRYTPQEYKNAINSISNYLHQKNNINTK